VSALSKSTATMAVRGLRAAYSTADGLGPTLSVRVINRPCITRQSATGDTCFKTGIN